MMIVSHSSDITFCMSSCGNELCSRNKNGRVFKAMMERTGEHGWYSGADFGLCCLDYKEKEDGL